MNNEKKFIKLTPFKMQVLQSFPFIDADFDAITNYELLCKVVEYLNTTVDNVNLLESDFKILYDYVHDYFDNLDVQEEINNKLDEMAESGQLTDIIAQYLGLAGMLTFNTVADMKNATNLVNGSICETLGFYTISDKGSAKYKIRNITNEDVVNEMNIIALNDVNLVAELVLEDEMNIKQFGAYGDGNSHLVNNVEQDGLSIQTAINNINGKINIPNGTYLVNTPITTNNVGRVYLSGESKFDTIIKYSVQPSSDVTILSFGNNTSRNIIENINFTSTYTSETISDYANYHVHGILFYYSSYNIVRNCRFYQLKSGIKFTWSWVNNVEDCYIARCNLGIDGVSSAINDLYIKACQIEYNDIGVSLGEGRTQSLYNCDIEKNATWGVQKTNEGSAEITNCYFEDKIRMYVGSAFPNNLLVIGCSFFQAPANSSEAYSPITVGGARDITRVSVINCTFKNLSSDSSTYNTPAIVTINNTTDIKPTLIGNTLVQMTLFNPNYYRGVLIDDGLVKDYRKRSFANNVINGTDGTSTALSINELVDYRINLVDSGNHTITLPEVSENERYTPHEFNLLVAGTNSDSRLSTVTLQGYNSNVIVHGDNTIDISDKNKIVKCVYIGYFSNKDNWQVIH